jgi:hypothetical protein
VRREAVEDIGGFPTDCLVEDICSSMLMIAEGWKTTYIPEGLQYGLVPETYAAHVKQFTRWVSLSTTCRESRRMTAYEDGKYIGGCQMALRFKGYLFNSVTKHMPLSVRLVGASMGLDVHIKPQLTAISYIITPFMFWTGTYLVYWHDMEEMRLLLRIHCGIVLSRWLHECHTAVMAGYRASVMDVCTLRFMTPCASLRFRS